MFESYTKIILLNVNVFVKTVERTVKLSVVLFITYLH
jgi:hypothetical protein